MFIQMCLHLILQLSLPILEILIKFPGQSTHSVLCRQLQRNLEPREKILLSPIIFGVHPLHHFQNNLLSDIVCQLCISTSQAFCFFPTGSITCVGPGSSSIILVSCRRVNIQEPSCAQTAAKSPVHHQLQTSLYRLFSLDGLIAYQYCSTPIPRIRCPSLYARLVQSSAKLALTWKADPTT